MKEIKDKQTPLGYYPWYPRDFATSPAVRSMNLVSRGIYRELLDIQWEAGILPPAERLLNIIGATASQWKEFAPYLEELFPDGVNPKMDALRQQAIVNREKQAEAGRKSAEARRTKVDATRVIKPSPKAKQFEPPTFEQVRDAMEQRCWALPSRRAEQFIAYYSSKDWKVGKTRMKDYVQAIITWESRMSESEFVAKPKAAAKVIINDGQPIEGVDFQILPNGMKVTMDGRPYEETA